VAANIPVDIVDEQGKAVLGLGDQVGAGNCRSGACHIQPGIRDQAIAPTTLD